MFGVNTWDLGMCYRSTPLAPVSKRNWCETHRPADTSHDTLEMSLRMFKGPPLTYS